jgi:hypothetical protein
MESLLQDRTERTAGNWGGRSVPAVSQANGAVNFGAGSVPPAPESAQTNFEGGVTSDSPETLPDQTSPLSRNVTIPLNISQANVIVGLPALKQFLQPLHPYFKDKQAIIDGFRSYTHTGNGTKFLYPDIKGQSAYASRHNPYRKYQLARAHSGRIVSGFQRVIDNHRLKDFRLVEIVLTVPAEVSEWLSNKENGKDIAWRIYKRFYSQLPEIIGINSGELAAGSNLHVWSSKEPLEPHYHVHALIPNYTVQYGEINNFQKWSGGGIVKRYQDQNGKWRTGCVPFSAEQLLNLKKTWTKAVRDTCHRYGISVPYFKDKRTLCDVYIGFLKWEDTSFGRAKFIHKINYQKRSWVEDYAIYSNDHTHCPDPPSWLEGYANRTRAFGWWMRLSELAGECVDGKEKISPLTGEPMIKADKVFLLDVLEGPLAGFDLNKGRPVWWLLKDYERKWLYQACNLDMQM